MSLKTELNKANKVPKILVPQNFTEIVNEKNVNICPPLF